tara:strand:+ start:6160 stop:7020 length:861 start_codon:yes stop_codon:yes gene_type:complete
MVRIAFCLFGLSYGNNDDDNSDKFLNVRNSRITYDISHKYFKKYIFDNNDNIDVFMHTWDNTKKDNILQLYNPVSYIFEKPIDFRNKGPNNVSKARVHSSYSMFYSIKKVINLKKKYEEDNNFEYDYVFLTRFDIYIQKPIIFSSYNKTFLYGGLLCKIYDQNNTEVPGSEYFSIIKNMKTEDIQKMKHIPDTESKKEPYNKHIHDLFFFSNSNYINVFSLLFDNIPNLVYQVSLVNKNTSEGTHSNCRLIYHHLKDKNLVDKIQFPFINNIDYGLIRRKYYNCTK